MNFTTILQTPADALDMAKGISDYGATIMLAAIMLLFIVYQIVDNIRRQKRADDRDEARELRYEQQNNGLAEVAEFARRAAEFFDERAARKVNIDQARAMVSSEFNRATSSIVVHILKVKKANNLEKTEAVRRGINIFIDGLYASSESMLRKFEFEGHPLSSFIESSWKERVKQRMIEDCATHEYNISRLEEAYRDEFLGFKNLLNQKLDDIQYKKS